MWIEFVPMSIAAMRRSGVGMRWGVYALIGTAERSSDRLRQIFTRCSNSRRLFIHSIRCMLNAWRIPATLSVFLLAALITSPLTAADSPGHAAISGVVHDQSGAAIPGVTV